MEMVIVLPELEQPLRISIYSLQSGLIRWGYYDSILWVESELSHERKFKKSIVNSVQTKFTKWIGRGLIKVLSEYCNFKIWIVKFITLSCYCINEGVNF